MGIRTPPLERFEKYVSFDIEPSAYRPDLGPCWRWRGALVHGYGYFRPDHGISGMRHAHRISYTWWIADVPAELEVDHLCRDRACVNPWHLKAVTAAENMHRARKDHCKRGHKYEEGTYHVPPGQSFQRRCRACDVIRGKRFRTRQKLGLVVLRTNLRKGSAS